MSKLEWDVTGNKFYETGVSQCALYVMDEDGKYGKGAAWSGVSAITESPSGAEATPIYADNIKYLNMMSAEELGGTIEAYMYPDEFKACNGEFEAADGVSIGQQTRKTFALAYKTIYGNDTDGNDYGYKLHIIYGALASPSEKAYSSTNDSPEAMTLSWEFTTTPVPVKDHKPTSIITIDSKTADPTKLAELEAKLYGSESEEATLALPNEVITMMSAAG